MHIQYCCMYVIFTCVICLQQSLQMLSASPLITVVITTFTTIVIITTSAIQLIFPAVSHLFFIAAFVTAASVVPAFAVTACAGFESAFSNIDTTDAVAAVVTYAIVDDNDL